MSDDLPVLVVDGDPADYITEDYYEDGTQVVPVRTTVRVDGPLPTVPARKNADGWRLNARPLRAGDRVMLAYLDVYDGDYDSYGRTDDPVPFATATVDKVLPVTSETTDAASVQIAPTGAAFELDEYTPGEPWTGGRRIEVPPGTKAGDYIVTVTDVEAP